MVQALLPRNGMKSVQVELVAEEGMGQQRDRTLGRVGDEDAIEDRLDEQRHHALRGAGQRHQHDGEQNLRPVLRPYDDQPQQLIHAGTRRRCSASSTWATGTSRDAAGRRHDFAGGAPRAPDAGIARIRR